MERKIPTWLIASIMIVGFLGFLDASFLTGEYYLHIAPPCFIVQGCDTVTTSSYSQILGIPVSLLGALYYLSVLVLTMYFIDKKKCIALQLLHGLTVIGFLMSLWFIYAQAYIIHAWCMYCLISALTSTLLFIMAALAFHKRWPNKVGTALNQ